MLVELDGSYYLKLSFFFNPLINATASGRYGEELGQYYYCYMNGDKRHKLVKLILKRVVID